MSKKSSEREERRAFMAPWHTWKYWSDHVIATLMLFRANKVFTLAVLYTTIAIPALLFYYGSADGQIRPLGSPVPPTTPPLVVAISLLIASIIILYRTDWDAKLDLIKRQLRWAIAGRSSKHWLMPRRGFEWSKRYLSGAFPSK